MPVVYDEMEEGGGQSGLVSGGGAPSGSGVVGAKPARSGSYTNLKKYLDAGGSSGARMAEQISGGITGQEEAAKEKVGALGQTFGEQMASETKAYNEYEPFVSSAIAKPAEFVSGGDMDRFKQIREGVYGGPQSLQDISGYQEALKGIASTKEAAAQTATPGGREALLRESYGRPSYTRGESTLDKFLLQATPQGKQRFAELRSQIAGPESSGQQLASLKEAAPEQIQQAKGTAQTASEQLRTALGGYGEKAGEGTGAIGEFVSGLQQKTAEAQAAKDLAARQFSQGLAPEQAAAVAAQRENLLNQIAERMWQEHSAATGRTHDPEGYKQWAMGRSTGPSQKPGGGALTEMESRLSAGALAGLTTPEQYLAKYAAAPTMQTVASAEDYAKAAALAQMAGLDTTRYLTTPSLAGTYQAIPENARQAYMNQWLQGLTSL